MGEPILASVQTLTAPEGCIPVPALWCSLRTSPRLWLLVYLKLQALLLYTHQIKWRAPLNTLCLWEPFHTLVTTHGPFESFLKDLKKPILVMIFQNFKACLLEP